MIPTNTTSVEFRLSLNSTELAICDLAIIQGLVCPVLTKSGTDRVRLLLSNLDTLFASYILATLIEAGSLANSIVVTPRTN
jgi:hypothetical protein